MDVSIGWFSVAGLSVIGFFFIVRYWGDVSAPDEAVWQNARIHVGVGCVSLLSAVGGAMLLLWL